MKEDLPFLVELLEVLLFWQVVRALQGGLLLCFPPRVGSWLQCGGDLTSVGLLCQMGNVLFCSLC